MQTLSSSNFLNTKDLTRGHVSSNFSSTFPEAWACQDKGKATHQAPSQMLKMGIDGTWKRHKITKSLCHVMPSLQRLQGDKPGCLFRFFSSLFGLLFRPGFRLLLLEKTWRKKISIDWNRLDLGHRFSISKILKGNPAFLIFSLSHFWSFPCCGPRACHSALERLFCHAFCAGSRLLLQPLSFCCWEAITFLRLHGLWASGPGLAMQRLGVTRSDSEWLGPKWLWSGHVATCMQYRYETVMKHDKVEMAKEL